MARSGKVGRKAYVYTTRTKTRGKESITLRLIDKQQNAVFTFGRKTQSCKHDEICLSQKRGQERGEDLGSRIGT